MTDASGQATFLVPQSPDDTQWLVWATGVGFQASFSGPIQLPQPGPPIELLLAQAEPIRTTVVDALGQPVPGATVRQRLLTLDNPSEAAAFPPESVVRALWREYTTDAAGVAILHAFPGEMEIQARMEPTVSALRRSHGDSSVRLELLDTATLGGLVSGDNTFALAEWAMVAVSAVVREESGAEHISPVGAVVVGEDGRFGPLELALNPDLSAFKVELLQGGNEAEVIEIAPPAPGEHAEVDFLAREGGEFWIQFLSEKDDSEIPDAAAKVTWIGDEGVEKSVKRRSRDNGWARFRGVPLNLPVTIYAEAPGFESTQWRPLWISAEKLKSGRRLKLIPTGSLEVQVTNGSEFIEDFVVHAAENRRSTAGYAFAESALPAVKGETPKAILPEMGEGGYQVDVLTGDGIFINRAFVQITGGQVAKLELDVAGTKPAIGKIVDREGNPVEGATLFLPIRHPYDERELSRAHLATTDASGQFRIPAVNEAPSRLMAVAEGYSNSPLGRPLLSDGVFDFGTSELISDGEFRFQLDPPTERWAAHSLIDPHQPEDLIRFNQEGLAECSLGPTVRTLKWLRPDGIKSELQGLVAGSNVQTKLPTGGNGQVHLELGDPASAGQAYESRLVFRRQLADGLHLVTEHRVSLRNSSYMLDGLPEGPLQIDWISYDQKVLHSKDYVLGPFDPVAITLEGEASSLDLLVTDTEGQPVEHALCLFYTGTPFNAARHMVSTQTNSEGRARLSTPKHPEYSLLVFSPDRTRSATATSLEILGGASPFPVVLGGTMEIALELESSGKPLEAAKVQLFGANGLASIATLRTGPDGRVRFENLAPGSYRALVSSSTAWLSSLELEAAPPPVNYRHSILPMGALKLRLIAPDGTPVRGFVPALHHHGLNESVHDWQANGQLYEGLRTTDASGSLNYIGLPSGHFSFKDSAGATHEFDLPARVFELELVISP